MTELNLAIAGGALAGVCAIGGLAAWLTAVFWKLGRIERSCETLPLLVERVNDHETRISHIEGAGAGSACVMSTRPAKG